MEHQANRAGFTLLNNKLHHFVFALVKDSTGFQFIAIGGNASAEASLGNKLLQCGLGPNGSLFTFSAGLPKTDVIH